MNGRNKTMNKLLKKLLVSAFLLAGSTGAWASEGWLTDFVKARKIAATKNVPILVDFSGSDWCGWCIKLDGEVFSKKAFKEYAEKNVVLFLADFPNGKKQTAKVAAQNEALSSKYGVRGFPTVLLLDAEGGVLARTGYRPGGPEAYVEHLKGLLKEKGNG